MTRQDGVSGELLYKTLETIVNMFLYLNTWLQEEKIGQCKTEPNGALRAGKYIWKEKLPGLT